MISSQRNPLIAILAMAALHNSEAFVAPSTSRITYYRPSLTNNSCKQRFSSRPLYESSAEQEQEVILSAENDVSSDNTSSVMKHTHEAKPIMDIPPSPAKSSLPHSDKTANKSKPKTEGNPHKEGIFSPIVVAAGSVLGQEQLNQIRAKAISLHSDIIKSFVDTSDSEFGKSVLKQLFNIVDVDGSGYLDKKEVGTALKLLGFKWLEEKHVEKIFERADLDENGEICLDEFMLEAPKTLRTNLIKLAKTNGGDMGLLV